MEVQSVVLPKSKYTLDKAINKVESMGYKSQYRGKVANQYKAGQTSNYWRFRQISPLKFEKDSFRTKKINDVFLVVAKKKSKI